MAGMAITSVPPGEPRRARSLEDRVLARLPLVGRALGVVVFSRLSPQSRLRRRLVVRAALSGWGAASRRDWDLVATRYAPDVEIVWDDEFAALGVGSYHGHAGMREMSAAISDAWERWEMVPRAVIDLGDRVLTLGTLRLPGNASGLEMETELAQLCVLRRALVARENEYFGWDKGLAAAGVDPEEIRPLL